MWDGVDAVSNIYYIIKLNKLTCKGMRILICHKCMRSYYNLNKMFDERVTLSII